jgi:hypothetical protein
VILALIARFSILSVFHGAIIPFVSIPVGFEQNLFSFFLVLVQYSMLLSIVILSPNQLFSSMSYWEDQCFLIKPAAVFANWEDRLFTSCQVTDVFCFVAVERLSLDFSEFLKFGNVATEFSQF